MVQSVDSVETGEIPVNEDRPCQWGSESGRRFARQKAFANNPSTSSRSLVSLDSVHSILSLDDSFSDDEDDIDAGHELSPRTTITITTIGVGMPSVPEHDEKDIKARHAELIQQSWRTMKIAASNKEAIGEKIILHMMEVKPSCGNSLGVSPLDRTPRFAEVSKKLMNILDRIVDKMEATDAFDDDLAEIGEEWLEEGLDARLVHKAILHCLQDLLNSDQFSYEAEEAWSTTFKDALLKITFTF